MTELEILEGYIFYTYIAEEQNNFSSVAKPDEINAPRRAAYYFPNWHLTYVTHIATPKQRSRHSDVVKAEAISIVCWWRIKRFTGLKFKDVLINVVNSALASKPTGSTVQTDFCLIYRAFPWRSVKVGGGESDRKNRRTVLALRGGCTLL